MPNTHWGLLWPEEEWVELARVKKGAINVVVVCPTTAETMAVPRRVGASSTHHPPQLINTLESERAPG